MLARSATQGYQDGVLVLWDVGGTLIGKSRSGALRYDEAVQRVLGLRVAPPERTSGSTEYAIIAELLQRNGLTPVDAQLMVDPVLAELEELTSSSRYLKEDRAQLPGVVDCVNELRVLGAFQTVATGNSRRKALGKLSEACVAHLIDLRAGGFGERTDSRAQIARVARARAGLVVAGSAAAFAPSRTVVIGDTPTDVIAGIVNGFHTVGVATGTSSAEELAAAGADLAIGDLDIGRAAIMEYVSRLR